MPYGNDRLDCSCHRLRRLCSVPHEISYTSLFWAAFKREPVYRFFSRIQRTYITVIRRCHTFKTLITRRHSQTHLQRRCLGHTSFSMHGDRRVYSPPCFRPGIDPFIGYPWRTGKMSVYRAFSVFCHFRWNFYRIKLKKTISVQTVF